MNNLRRKKFLIGNISSQSFCKYPDSREEPPLRSTTIQKEKRISNSVGHQRITSTMLNIKGYFQRQRLKSEPSWPLQGGKWYDTHRYEMQSILSHSPVLLYTSSKFAIESDANPILFTKATTTSSNSNWWNWIFLLTSQWTPLRLPSCYSPAPSCYCRRPSNQSHASAEWLQIESVLSTSVRLQSPDFSQRRPAALLQQTPIAQPE